MMRAILSNDDEDWHSHLEQSVKESGLDWQAGFFMIGSGECAGDAARIRGGQTARMPRRAGVHDRSTDKGPDARTRRRGEVESRTARRFFVIFDSIRA
ncbi:hypothetical protein [Burkholderia cenocepacia]|uniref:hypothetical protein n=1 Tax=Burkholderia cenocepacia TaxID=95486 RepID=UPI001BA897E8|nr:hypothetical protein [Burkholderia cenocepacia]